MATKHHLRLIVPKETGEEKGREMLIDQIIAMFPDAIVDSAADITPFGNDIVVHQVFRSPMFDRIAEGIAAATVSELDLMVDEIQESVLVTGHSRKIYVQALRDAQQRLSAIWGLE